MYATTISAVHRGVFLTVLLLAGAIAYTSALAQEVHPVSTASQRSRDLERLIEALEAATSLEKAGLTSDQGLAVSQYVWAQVNRYGHDLDSRQDALGKELDAVRRKGSSLESRIRRIEQRQAQDAERSKSVSAAQGVVCKPNSTK